MKRLVCVLIMLAATGCAVENMVQVKDGQEYGVTEGLFRGRWWSYYERGLSYADGEFFQEAVQDFEQAIKNRGDDQWRSRTYGLHFINYFPHRELGIVYYRLNRYIDAEREIEASLKTAESAKAKYFLNKIRKSILEQSGNDLVPPSIHIHGPQDGVVTQETSIPLTGEAEDDQFVSSLAVNAVPLPLELSSQKVQLMQNINVNSGMNRVTVTATDLMGKTAEQTIHIYVDREGPVILIEDYEIRGRNVVLSGYITDSTEITSAAINGTPVTFSRGAELYKNADDAYPGQELGFQQEVSLPDGSDVITLTAWDKAGNITLGTFQVPASDTSCADRTRLAYSEYAGPGLNRTLYAFIGSGLGKLIDDTKPVIRIKDLADMQTIYSENLYIEGSVSDNSKIDSLLINGESVIKRKGTNIFFNHLASLQEGSNSFRIEATDVYGNRAERIISVTRKVANIRKIGSRMSISVLPLVKKGQQSVAGDAVYETLLSSLVRQKRFQIIERERMDDVLRELELSQTELVDSATASKIGKIIVSDAILTGTIVERNDSIEVFTRLIDTETSNILETKDVFDEDTSLSGIKKLMEGLALKYKESFPLLEGIIIKAEGKTVLSDLGEDQGIRENVGLILFREGDEVVHPITESILGSEPLELGEAAVDAVYKDFSRAAITKGVPSGIRIKDKVITK